MAGPSGRCLCGAVTFTTDEVEREYHACHCGMCRRWVGGPLMGTIAHGVRFEGEEHLVRYPSSEWAERGFCRQCGSSLFYYLKPAQAYVMSVGAFEDAASFTLAREIYIDHKPAGYELAGTHPRWTEAETLAHFAGEGS